MRLQFPPQTLFLIDGMGALVSAILLGIVLPRFDTLFGMPQNTLFVLAGLAVLFCIYSLSCYFLKPVAWQKNLRLIGIVNLSYCVLTAVLMVYFKQQLTTWDVLYFAGEMGLVITLAILELRTARN